MDMQPALTSLPCLLFRYAFSIKHNLAKIAETYDINVMQAFTLCALDEHGSIHMNQLGSLLYCDASHVTGIVERLHATGLLDRKECSSDRRLKELSLTAKGVAVRKDILEKLNTTCTAISTRLSHEEIIQLESLLQKALQPKQS